MVSPNAMPPPLRKKAPSSAVLLLVKSVLPLISMFQIGLALGLEYWPMATDCGLLQRLPVPPTTPDILLSLSNESCPDVLISPNLPQVRVLRNWRGFSV